MIYHVQSGDTLSRIAKAHQCSVRELLHFNPKYRANPDRLYVGSQLFIPKATEQNNKLVRSTLPTQIISSASDSNDFLKVPFGQLTFDAEGNDKKGSRYFSRVLHVPSRSSGATIGRGYDMKERTEEEVLEDLATAKVSKQVAKKLASCHGFSGALAKQHINEKDLGDIEISQEQQHILFAITVEELWGDCLRLMTKADVVAAYGETDVENLPQKVKDLILDLRYRGDYTPVTRRKIQPLLVARDYQGFGDLLSDQQFWRTRLGVPKDRFNRRAKYGALIFG